jgi:hypothetical protein
LRLSYSIRQYCRKIAIFCYFYRKYYNSDHVRTKVDERALLLDHMGAADNPKMHNRLEWISVGTISNFELPIPVLSGQVKEYSGGIKESGLLTGRLVTLGPVQLEPAPPPAKGAQ